MSPRIYERLPLTERFWSKVNKNGPTMPKMKTRCWVWTAYAQRGYGVFPVNGTRQLAHRVAFYLKYGRWPEPQALHRCDNPPCVRWSHLFEGTHGDNGADMVLKGWSLRGSKNNLAKLTSAEVKEIRRLYATGKWTQLQLAKKFGVTVMVINNIVNHKSWRHV